VRSRDTRCRVCVACVADGWWWASLRACLLFFVGKGSENGDARGAVMPRCGPSWSSEAGTKLRAFFKGWPDGPNGA